MTRNVNRVEAGRALFNVKAIDLVAVVHIVEVTKEVLEEVVRSRVLVGEGEFA